MQVAERATRDNFFADGYLRMNADIARFVRGGGNAWKHFLDHGEREGRLQISRAFLAGRAERGARKFARFSRLLATPAHASSGTNDRSRGACRFLQGTDAFPVAFSDAHHLHDDYASESANNSYPPFEGDILRYPDRNFLDLGCGLRKEVFDNCLYLEVYPSVTADVIVAPDCEYPLISEAFDGIGCFAVLEHVTQPWVVAAEIRRMLKPGGKCYICWPFLQPVHGYPSHYYNATRRGLELMFSDGFDIEFCRTEPWETPADTIAWVLGKFVRELPAGKRERVMAMTVAELAAQPPHGGFWTELMRGLPDALVAEFACGNSLVATKR